MKGLVLGSMTPFTGNRTTALRIGNFFEQTCTISYLDTSDLSNDCQKEVQNWKDQYDFGVGIHLFRSGRYLLESEIPFFIIIGGTDVNEYVKEPSKKEIMRRVVEKSLAVIAFSPTLSSIVRNIWPDECQKRVGDQVYSKVRVIEPSFLPSYSSSASEPFSLRKSLGLKEETKIFLLPTGLRPVKDPLFLVSGFFDWTKRSRHPERCLVIIGPKLSPEYSNYFFDEISRMKNSENDIKERRYWEECVQYHEPVSSEHLYDCISESFVVLNSSLSEGLSNVILESFYLNRPVIARKNEGNSSVIEDQKTGLLFSTVDEFIEKSSNILNSKTLYDSLCSEARNHLNTLYSPENEKKQYLNLLTLLL